MGSVWPHALRPSRLHAPSLRPNSITPPDPAAHPATPTLNALSASGHDCVPTCSPPVPKCTSITRAKPAIGHKSFPVAGVPTYPTQCPWQTRCRTLRHAPTRARPGPRYPRVGRKDPFILPIRRSFPTSHHRAYPDVGPARPSFVRPSLLLTQGGERLRVLFDVSF